MNRAGHDAVYEAEGNGKEDVVEWLLAEGKGLEEGVKGRGGESGARVDGLREGVEGMRVVDEV